MTKYTIVIDEIDFRNQQIDGLFFIDKQEICGFGYSQKTKKFNCDYGDELYFKDGKLITPQLQPLFNALNNKMIKFLEPYSLNFKKFSLIPIKKPRECSYCSKAIKKAMVKCEWFGDDKKTPKQELFHPRCFKKFVKESKSRNKKYKIVNHYFGVVNVTTFM